MNLLTENTPLPEAVPAFKLDWNDTEITLAKGKFKHFIKRPEPLMIVERDGKIPSEVPIAKDRSYALNAGSDEQDVIDAEYYDKVKAQDAEGYNGKIPPVAHRAAAFRAIYRRFVYIADHSSAFDDIVEIHEVFGDPENPIALIKHFIRQPEEKELTRIKNAINNTRIAPDKRNRQKFVTESSLKKAMAFYRAQLDRIENATVAGKSFAESDRNEFINVVDPLVQEMVVAVFVKEATSLLED